MEYDVGQVLYAVSSKEMRVVPLRVTERIVRQTLQGEIVTYVAQLPDGREITDLSKLAGDVHVSIEEVREKMILSITEVVDKIVDTAKETAVQSFGRTDSSSLEKPDKAPDNETEDPAGKSKITLPDGTVANVTLPQGL